MFALLMLGSIVAVILSVMLVSEATMGVYVVGIAVWLAALSRIAQAEKQHNELVRVTKGEQIEKAVSDARRAPATV